MKKLSILLIGLLLVTGLAFADFGDVDVSGSASVTFGVDLDNGTTGFANAGTSSVTITLVDEADAEATGDDGLYGTITIEEYSLEIEDGVIVSALGDVSASITVDPAVITIYSAPSLSLDYAATIDSGTVEGDISTGISATGTNVIGGVTISIPAGPADIDLMVASDGDWNDNAANNYAVGTEISVDVAPATIDLGFIYGWFGTGAVVGLSAAVELDIAPATITVGFDGDASVSGAFAFDIAAGAAVDLSEANDDDDTANVSLDAYVYTGGTDLDLDVALGFAEPTDGGLMDMLGASVTLELLDVVAALAWNVDVTGEYDTGDLMPYFGFGFGTDGVFDLNVGVELYETFTGIDNTTVVLDYESPDLAASILGVITVMAEVSL
jgi:hypothetical protein